MVDARVRTDRRWTPGAAAVSIDKSIMTSVKFTHDTTNKPNIQHGNNQPPVHRIFAHPCQPKAQGQRSPKAPHANRPFSSPLFLCSLAPFSWHGISCALKRL